MGAYEKHHLALTNAMSGLVPVSMRIAERLRKFLGNNVLMMASVKARIIEQIRLDGSVGSEETMWEIVDGLRYAKGLCRDYHIHN